MARVGSMADTDPIRGDLQQEIMKILWAADSASVEEVRTGLPDGRRGAYTTVQTVLNRLADRGLVRRNRQGKAIRYEAAISETDYVAGSLQRTLEGASDAARLSALTNLVEKLPAGEFEAISDLAEEINRRRS